MSETELAIYKQRKLDELSRLYQLNVLRLNTYTVSTIRSIQRTRSRNKQALINAVISKYNTDVAALKVNYTRDTDKVKAFQPTMMTNASRKKALLIGCNYLNTPYSLTGCIDDADRMQQMLRSRGFDSCDMVTDLTTVKPTKSTILNKFKYLLANARAGDMLFFYFSGHGSYMRDRTGDETDGNDEMIISTDLQGVTDDELRQIITEHMKEDVCLIAMFDSCHSGTMMDLKYTYLDNDNYNGYTENPNVGDMKGDIIMISGCTDQQTSSEALIENKMQGALTWTFLDNVEKNPGCSWRELIRSMRDALKTEGYTQLPQISTGAFENIYSQICF